MSQQPLPTSQTLSKVEIIDPAQIEPQLIKIWEGLVKENKMRASLFNLIVYNQLQSPRTDYIRSIVQKVIEKFPCRILFISHDPNAKQTYLKTAVSVVTPKDPESTIACDHIDFGVAGPDLERVPFLLLPHIIPDLPVYVLWMEDPCKKNPLLMALAKLATRMIFDSESADSLLHFAEKLLALRETGIDIADLNWARTEGWRDLITSTFQTAERLKQLHQLCFIQITYNSRETESFCHLKVQAMYLLAWMSSRLKWKLTKASKKLTFQFESNLHKIDAHIQPTLWEKLGSGTVVSVELKTVDEHLFQCMRLPQQYHRVGIQISTPEKCDLPYQFVLGQTATGQSLVNEIIKRGTSSHYMEMLKELIELDRKDVC